jgi:hypothetical protein
MDSVEPFYITFVIIQLLHSQEEIYTHFEKRWPVWKMSRKFFVTFEVIFSALTLSVIFFKDFPGRYLFMSSFNVLMFANGVWHCMWAGVEKRYVPGLITAPFFIITFLIYYFNAVL